MNAHTNKINGALLLKWLAAFCALDSVAGQLQAALGASYTEDRDDGCYLCVPIDADDAIQATPTDTLHFCVGSGCTSNLDTDVHCERMGEEKCRSCMSGNTGTFKANPGSFERTITTVKELTVGDKIEGLGADKQPALCTVEAIGQFGHGALYGNYTKDHFVLDPATGNVMQHGAVGNRTVEDKYEVMTSCPVGLDEAGTGFTPMDGDFCGKSTSEMGWSDYLLIHASMLRIVRATGGYWFSASAYSDFKSVVQHGPELCAAMLACAGDGIECDELERISTLFVDNYLADDAREATLKGMPGCGEVGAPGSVSFVVSQGRAGSTERTVLIAAGAVAGAAVLALLLVVAVVARTVFRRKRSPPAPATVELEPGTLKLDLAAPLSKRPSQEGDGVL